MLKTKWTVLVVAALTAALAVGCSDDESSNNTGGSGGDGGTGGTAGAGGDGGTGGTGGGPAGALEAGDGSTSWQAEPKEATDCVYDAETTTCSDCTISETGVPGGGSCGQFGPQIVAGCEVPGGVLNTQLALDVVIALDASSTGDGNLTHDVSVSASHPALAAAAGLVTVDSVEVFSAVADGTPAELVNSLDPALEGTLLGDFTQGSTTLELDDEILPETTAVTTTAVGTVDVNLTGDLMIGLTVVADGSSLPVDSSSCTFDNPAPNDGAPIEFGVIGDGGTGGTGGAGEGGTGGAGDGGTGGSGM
jgi:hypothetical protein